jgi:hypothetical protein
LHYSLTEKGNVYFYTGEEAVIKNVPAKIRQLQRFLNDLEEKLAGSQQTPSPTPDGQADVVVGVADYYDWLLLRAALDGKSPHTYKDLGEEFGKPVNLSYLYKLHDDLERIGYIGGDWITDKGKERLAALERALASEVQKAQERVNRLEKAKAIVKSWVRERNHSKV